jgi:hypothetical protein
VTVRLARAPDRDAVLAFATHTWGGWDYVPGVWDAWLAAPDGLLLVACATVAAAGADGTPVAAGQPVAMSRLALLAPGEAWVEGIRVDPRVRGRDVATNLQLAELAWAAAHDVRVVRYMTGQENEGSLRLGARHGFVRLTDRRSYGPGRDTDPDPARPSDPSALRTLEPEAAADEVARWWRFVADDPTFAAGDGLYEPRGWAFQALDESRFAAHVRRGEVGLARDGRALAVVPGLAGGAPDPALLVGEGRSALTLLDDLRRGAGQAPRPRLPDPDPPMLAGGAAERWAAGGFPPHEHALHLLGRPMDGPLPEAVPPGILILGDRPRAMARPPDA